MVKIEQRERRLKVTRMVVTGNADSPLTLPNGFPSPPQISSPMETIANAKSGPTKGEGIASRGGGPSLGKRFKNLARDVGVVMEMMFEGKLPVEKREMVAEKLKVCAGCAWWRPVVPRWMPGAEKLQEFGLGICGHEECGCLMGFKARLVAPRVEGGVKTKGVGCPENKWVL